MPAVAGFIGGMFSFGAGAAFAAGGAAFSGWVAGAAFSSTILGGIATKLLTTVAISALSQALAPDPAQGGGITISATVRGEHQPETIILGKYATGGQAICPPYSHGRSNAYLTHVIELCSAPGARLERIMLGDDWVDLGATPHAEYGLSVTSGPYEGLVWVKYHDGSQTVADPMLRAKYGDHPDRPWTADMVGAGLCYAIITFKFDKERLTSVPQYRFELGGVPLYDRRKDSSAGGAGPQRLSDPSTWEATENAAVIAWNVMRGVPLPGGEIWGGNITDLSELPWAVWSAAMNRCDAEVSIAGGGTEPAYRAGLEVSLDQPPAAALEEVFKACSATVADLGYGWGIVVGAPALPVYSFTDDDIIVSRQQELDPFPSIEETNNAVTARYPDPESLYETKEAPRRTNAEFEAADAFGRRMANLALPAAPYKRQVQRLTRAWLEDARRFRRHVICLPPDAAHIELIDTVDWSSVRNGYDGKDFSVHEITEDPRTGIRQLSIRERDPADYNWVPGFELPSVPTQPGTTPALPEPVSGFDATDVILTDADGVGRRAGIRMFWATDILAEGLRWQIRLAGQSEATFNGTTQAVDAGMLTVAAGILPKTTYQVRMRLIAERPTVWSDWITVTTKDVRISREELEADILADLETLERWITDGVDDLAEELLALAQAIEAESQARADAAAQLAQDLAAEAQARANAIAAEQQARAAAVQGLAGDLADQAQAQAAAVQAVADALATEQQGRLDDARALADSWRQLRDRVGAITAEVVELANADHLAREEIRRSIAVQIGDLRASYDERISTIIGDNLVAVQRIETLEATSGNLTAEVQRVDQARIDGENALALSIASLAVGTDNQFDAAHIWHFDASVEGWTGGAWQAGGWLRTSGQITSPAGLALAAGRYSQIRLRLRRSGSVTWAGYAWWAGAGQAWDIARRIEISEPTWTDDIGLITVTLPWTGTVDRVRLEFGTGTLDLDWVALGRPAPGASSAELDSLRQAMITADEAMAEDITQLDARMAGAEGGLDAQAGAIGGLEARVTSSEGAIASQGTALTALEGRVTNAEAQVDLNADAIDVLKTYVESGGDGSQIVAAEAIRSLRSAVRRLAAEGAEGAAREHLGIRQVREYVAEASQSLSTRIDLTDDQVQIVAEAVTLLQAAIPGLASAQALQSLIATVTDQGGILTAHGLALTDIAAELNGKASASALQQLETTVTSQGNTLTAQGQAITALQTGLAGKANASAVQALETTVAQQGAAISSQAQAITAIEADLDGLGGALAGKAGISAVQALEGRVDDAEGAIASQGTALTALEGRVTNAEAELESNAQAIDQLRTQVENGGDGSQIVAAEAIRALRSAVRRLAAEGAEGAAREHLGIRQVREYVAEASQSLSTRIDLTDDQVRIVAEAVTLLQAAIPGLASAQALQSLIATVTDQGGILTAHGLALTDIAAELDGKASASALQQLETTVTSHGNTLTAQGQAITALQTGLAGKANASAVQALETTVAQQGAAISSQGQAITNIEVDLDNLDGALAGKASTSAVQALTGRVEATETQISSHSGLITSLRNDVDGKASGSALSALESVVSQQAGQISSQGSAIVSLNNSLSDTITLAEGKGRVFVQSSAPPVAERRAQNLWIDTTGSENIPKRWNGSAWAAVRDKAATDALAQVASKASSSAVTALTSRVSATEATIASQANALTVLESSVGRMRAGGRFRVSTSATPTGADARIGLHAEASDGKNTHTAGLWLVAESNGTTSVTVMADRFAIVTGTGANATRRVPFIVKGGEVWIDSARIETASIGTLHLENGAVSTFERAYAAGSILSGVGGGTVQTLTYSIGRTGPQVVFCAARATANSVTSVLLVRLYRNGESVYQTQIEYWAPGRDINFTYIDPDNLSGSITYRLDITALAPAGGGGAMLTGVSNRFLGVLNVYK